MTRVRREWVGARMAFPGYVMEGGPHRPDLITWIELPGGLVVGSEVIGPDRHVSCADVVRAAMAKPLVGPPRRPDRLRVADAALAAELRAAALGIEFVVAPTPEIDEMLEQMTEALTVDADEASYLEDGAVPEEAVAELFAAAQALWAIAPWKKSDDDQILRVDVPAFGITGGCLSVIGALGQHFGFLLFESLAGLDRFTEVAERSTPQHIDLGSSILSLAYERGAELSPKMRREVARHAWPVADPRAHPRVEHRDRDGILRPLQERDVRLMTAIATSLTAFFAKHPRPCAEDGEPICESWFDENDLEVRLTAPYEAYELFDIAAAASPSSRTADAPARIGRNAPCPCGSGKKYKKCCLSKDEEVRRAAVEPVREPTSPGARHHDLDMRLVAEMCAFAEERFGARWRRFEKDFLDPELALQLALPWSVYGFQVEGQPVVHWFLRAASGRVSPDERAWLAAQQRAWLGIWEVTDVEPGIVTVVDLLSGAERRVHETNGSRVLVARDAVLARVVDFGGRHLFCGLHPRPLSPLETADVVRSMRTKLRCRAEVPVERLREEEVGRHLIRRWERTVRTRDRQVPPRFTNTDGDDIALTVDTFAFEAARRRKVLDHLRTAEGAAPEDEHDDGTRVTFLRAGDRRSGGLEATIIGTVHVTADRLRVETNSPRRADELRHRIAAACGTLVRHLGRTGVGPVEELAKRSGRASEPLSSPEAAELVRSFKARHYATWADEPLPALRGKTPRAAVHTARGRAAVEALVKHMEHGEARLPPAERYDFTAVRRALGLPVA